MRIDLTISIGYSRLRGTTTDRWEARATTVGLLLSGAIVAVVLVVIILPRVLEALGKV